MSVRSASRGSPAARSIRLALCTSSIVATSSASFTRCVLRCFGRRCLSSALRLAAISVMPFIVRFQDPPRADALNHTPIRYVNNVLSELMDGKGNLTLIERIIERLDTESQIQLVDSQDVSQEAKDIIIDYILRAA